MAHFADIAAIIVGCWIILALFVTLVLGRWMQRASQAPTGPTPYRERVRSVARGGGRLLLLPYVAERSAREQARRRALRSTGAQGRDVAHATKRDTPLQGGRPAPAPLTQGDRQIPRLP